MLGAIIGDIIGSPYEFKHKSEAKEMASSKHVSILPDEMHFTDDTVLTCAVANATAKLISICEIFGDEDLKQGKCTPMFAKIYSNFVINELKKWAESFPDAGYGGMFRKWLKANWNAPYGSYGNGAAMRVSSLAYLSTSVKMAERLAEIQCEVTHNTEKAVNSAKAVVGSIYLALHGYDKHEIQEYLQKYGYSFDTPLDEIRPNYKFDATADSVPIAIQCFLESESFEDAIRLAISMGGDTDTMACIAGSIAEPYHGLPNRYINLILDYIDPKMKECIKEFQDCQGYKMYRPIPITAFMSY